MLPRQLASASSPSSAASGTTGRSGGATHQPFAPQLQRHRRACRCDGSCGRPNGAAASGTVPVVFEELTAPALHLGGRDFHKEAVALDATDHPGQGLPSSAPSGPEPTPRLSPPHRPSEPGIQPTHQTGTHGVLELRHHAGTEQGPLHRPWQLSELRSNRVLWCTLGRSLPSPAAPPTAGSNGAVVQRRTPGRVGRVLGRQRIGPRFGAELHRCGYLTQLLLQHPAAIGAGKGRGKVAAGVAAPTPAQRNVKPTASSPDCRAIWIRPHG